MSTLESIIQWAQDDLEEWQSDAVRRLLTQDELTDNDKSEILTMLKERHGLTDPTQPAAKPQPLKKGQVSGVPPISSTVTLKALQDLHAVNAVPDGSHLSFGHQGLTVVYGENGSGKSAYARILKKACKARDTKEQILPNAFASGGSTGPAQASIKISVNSGPDEYVAWQDGQDASEILSSVCVFDSRCARIILNENNEPMYLPYGTDVFARLVDLMKDLRKQLEEEKPELTELEYADILPTTNAGQFISQLSQDTSISVVEEKTTWTKEDDLNLSKLLSQIAVVEALDPKGQAQRLRNLKDTLDVIINNIRGIEQSLSELNADSLREAITNFVTLESAVAIASQESFANEPLAGVGSNVWQVLYNAAREYSTQMAYPNQDFPVTGNEALCVFCLQPLREDGKLRMLRFKTFMEGTIKKQLDSADEALQEKRKDIEQTPFPPTEIVKSVTDEILSRNESLAQQMEEYLPAMQTRQKQMLRAITNKETELFPPPKPIAIECLAKVSDQIEEEAQHIEKAAEPEELAAKKAERDELQAWKLLSQRKQDIITYVTQLKARVKYDACIAETATKAITSRGKAIISAALTDTLREALGRELESLNAGHLPLNLKTSGVEGEARHRMELTGSRLSKVNLSEILSEGEQQVVAIAGFLAELGIRNDTCPIVLDDPVCSLDHQYRDKIAERLAKEAPTRQVIVFTHDIAFLLELENNAVEQNAYLHAQTVRKYSGSPGVCSDDFPWDAMSVGKRTNQLDSELSGFKDSYNIDWDEYNPKASYLYGQLRETWEAAIEEELLNQTIRRHLPTVQTRRLRGVAVTTEDYVDIDRGMAKCSTWMVGHAKSRPLSANRPAPDEIRKDIDSLNAFRARLKGRRAQLESERDKVLEPKQADAG
ncbi:MAG: AAA family ATPase [Chloroflexi bacterium]|nr:AAA family ATPase [Chloroflexota bacterium]